MATSTGGTRSSRRARGWPKLLAVLIAVGVAFGGGWWAAVTVTSAADDEPAAVEPVLADVVEASVGRSVTYTATVRQPFVPIATNTLTGVVTSVAAQEEPLDVGDALYVVGATAVRVVQGEEPFWRPLQAGVKGEDVAQLQRALITLGHLAAGADDGDFGSATTAAVREWQRDLGQERTGTIGLGEVVAVPSLPQPLALGEEIYNGAQLTAGTGSVAARTGEVVAELVLGPDQARLIPPEAAISLSYEDASWPVVVSGQSENENSQSVLTLTAPEGGPVCGSDCDVLPAVEELALSAAVELSPTVTGPAVPVTAVRTGTDGNYVVLEDGTEVPVTVLGSSGGLAVVEGLEVGQIVRLGEQADTPTDEGQGDGADG